MAKRLWVGLDVGVETTSICVIDADGAVLHEAVCPTNARKVHREIVSLGCRRSGVVGLEAGTGVGLARDLRDLGYTVEIYEARQLSKFLRVRRNKTDAGDALGIAHAGRIASPLVSRVHLKSLECQSIACRLKIRRYFIKARMDAVSIIRRQLELYGVRIAPGSPATFHPRVVQAIRTTFGTSPDPLARDMRHLVDHVEAIRTHKIGLDRELKKIAFDNGVCRQLMEIPGVGPICALSFYATVGEPERFRRSSDIGPYLGLTPRLHQSGLVQRSGRISRMGNANARGLLIQASLRFMKCCDPQSRLRAWTSEIEGRRGRGKSRVALARKLATVMIAMWKKGTPFDPQLLLATG